jgi:hypothetical protein
MPPVPLSAQGRSQSARLRLALSPRRARPLFANISSRQVSGFSFSDSLAALTLCNEAESGSLALRLAALVHGDSAPGLLPPLSASLHAGYSVGMMNTFQFIGLVGGAGAPEHTEQEGNPNLVRTGQNHLPLICIFPPCSPCALWFNCRFRIQRGGFRRSLRTCVGAEPGRLCPLQRDVRPRRPADIGSG